MTCWRGDLVHREWWLKKERFKPLMLKIQNSNNLKKKSFPKTLINHAKRIQEWNKKSAILNNKENK